MCFSLFVTELGKVYACGWGADGQTGLGSYENQALPASVKGDITTEKIVKVASTGDCVLALNGEQSLLLTYLKNNNNLKTLGMFDVNILTFCLNCTKHYYERERQTLVCFCDTKLLTSMYKFIAVF